MTNINEYEDLLDVRNIIARVEELESETDADPSDDELRTLTKLLDDLCGKGGDEQWRGHWYPVTLIRESYFEESMDEMVADCYNIDALKLPSFLTVTVDYDALKMDYDSVDFCDVTYLFR